MQANDVLLTAPAAHAHYQICAPRVAHQTIDGETVIIDFETGAYYSLTRVGAEVWELLAAGHSVPALMQALLARYRAEPAEIETALGHFLSLLERETLIAAAASAPEAAALVEAAPLADRPAFEPPTLHKYTDMADLLLLDPIHDVDETGWPSKKA